MPLNPPPGEPRVPQRVPRRQPADRRRPSARGFSLPVPHAVHAARHVLDHAVHARRRRGGAGRRAAACASASSRIRRRRPANDLLVVWTPGPANDLDRPTTLPYYDAGLYLVPRRQRRRRARRPRADQERPAYNEAWPRAVVPYRDVHGVDEPASCRGCRTTARAHAQLPRGHAVRPRRHVELLQARELPRLRAAVVEHLRRPRRLQHAENGQSSNWGTQGADAGQVHERRHLGGAHRRDGAEHAPQLRPERRPTQLFAATRTSACASSARSRCARSTRDGAPVLDPEGNPDTSFLAKIPADTPFTFQTLDRNGTGAQHGADLAPGAARRDARTTAAAATRTASSRSPSTPPPRRSRATRSSTSSHVTPLLTRDAQRQPGAARRDRAGASTSSSSATSGRSCSASCVPCHTKNDPTPPGNLVLDDLAIVRRPARRLLRGSPTTATRAGATRRSIAVRLAADQRQPLRAHASRAAAAC